MFIQAVFIGDFWRISLNSVIHLFLNIKFFCDHINKTFMHKMHKCNVSEDSNMSSVLNDTDQLLELYSCHL